MSMIGMNVDEVTSLSAELNRTAEALRSEAERLQRSIQGVAWSGRDADQFRNTVWPTHFATLRAAAEGLVSASDAAKRNIEEQVQASDRPGSAGTGSGTATIGAAAGAAGATTGAVAQGAGAPSSLGVTPAGRSQEEISAVYEKHVPDFFRQKGFEYQCTAWANTRWRELGFDGQVNGNGGEMAKNAGPTSSTPTLHALGSYGAGTNSNPGHVMVVEEISGDGSRIRISEMNNGDDNWNVGHLNEYRDDLWLTRDAGGVFRYDGHAVNFAKFPGT